MSYVKRILQTAVLAVVLAGCSSTLNEEHADEKIMVDASRFELAQVSESAPETINERISPKQRVNRLADKRLISLEPITSIAVSTKNTALPRDIFDSKVEFNLSAKSMPLRDFIHYVLADLLEVNYVLDESFEDDEAQNTDRVSLRLDDPLNAVELFDFVSELLSKRGVQLEYDSDIFFVHRPKDSGASAITVIGIGAGENSVPRTAQTILQVVPLQFGIKVSTERTLRALTKVKITPDYAQNALFLEGRRAEIIQALELLKLFDTRAMRGNHIGIVRLDHLSAQIFGSEVAALLKNEGIDIGLNDPTGKNLVLVPLAQMNAVAVFATDRLLLDRVIYWANIIDVQKKELGPQFFVYSPLYTRAKDLGTSIQSLIQAAGSLSNSSPAVGGPTGNAPSSARVGAAVNEKMTLVVDENANVLIFYSEPSEYEAVLPLLKSLDVLPRQVMLDIVIAEVSLKDEFKYGVEWALQRGEATMTTQGAFGATSIGGLGFSVIGADGPIDASFLSTNNKVKVLSNPSLMVRDGVTASIDVGSDVAVVGETTSDPISGERQTITTVYRKTGVRVSVSPTINSFGTIVMEIDQSISNSIPGTTGSSGNPDIFERAIKTEIVAQSGQTVMLGGLISENYSSGGAGVPLLSKIPLIGALFKSNTENSDRTELVMLITPRVINDLSEWQELKDSFKKGLEALDF